MKPILFATNYSTASENAGDYAAQLAKLCNTSLVVLHSWTLPVLTPEDAVALPPVKEFHAREKKEVNKEVMRLRTRWGIPVTGVEVNGYTPDEIDSLTKDQDISLVVLGMHHHNYCSRLLGSVATTPIHQAGFPVLLVPDSASFTPPSKILLAVEPAYEISEPTLNQLKLITRTTGATLEIVHVESPEHIWNVDESPAMIRMEHSLRYLKHKSTVAVNDHITEGINHAAEQASADWIAVAPRHFSWFENIFRKGITKKLAYTVDRPLFILPSETHQLK